MKYQSLFSENKNKKNIINLSAAEYAQTVVKFKNAPKSENPPNNVDPAPPRIPLISPYNMENMGVQII